MAPHTATGEWQSFEVRMRRRRAERLAIRAEVAAEAGYLEDARGYLEEARALAPGLPLLSEAERVLESARKLPALTVSSTAASAVGRPRIGKYTAAAAAAFLAVTAVAFGGARGSAPLVLPSRPLSLTVDVPAPPVDPRPVARIKDKSIEQIPATRRNDVVPPPKPAPLPGPSVVPAAFKGAPVAALPAAAPSLPAPVASEPFAPPTETPAPEVPATEPPQEPLVRGVLDRYASAYSALDADAARRVWPGVNRDALARAFDGLASQNVSLGKCSVNVNGATARANCDGSATWAPKVGAGRRTEPRQWSFELSRESGDWRIVNARVQNK